MPEGDVVVIGGGLVGCEVALHLDGRENGGKVTMIEALDGFLNTVSHFGTNDQSLRDHIAQSGIDIVCSGRVSGITETGVTYEKDGEVREVPCSAVVMAVGYRSNHALEDEIWNDVDNVRTVGDAVKPRKVIDAVHEAFHAVRVLK